MSDYFITQITASDKRGNRLVDELLTSEGIRRDGNLDYTCGMYDDEMNLIATGSCFGNTLRCMAVSHEHQGEGLMNSIVSHLIELQFSRGNTHLFLYTKCDSARFFGDLGFYEIAQIGSARLSFAKPEYMEKYLDITPGSVSVLGLMNDHEKKVQLLIDEDVLKDPYFGCHPCINTSSLKFSTKDFTDKIIPALDHPPITVKLPLPEEQA